MLHRSRDRFASPSPLPAYTGLLLGLPAAVLAQVVAWACDPADVAVSGLVLAAVAAALVATTTSTAGAVVAGALAWAVYDGFAAHRFGELHAGTTDLRAVAVVVGAALVVRGLAAVTPARMRAGARVRRTVRSWG